MEENHTFTGPVEIRGSRILTTLARHELGAGQVEISIKPRRRVSTRESL